MNFTYPDSKHPNVCIKCANFVSKAKFKVKLVYSFAFILDSYINLLETLTLSKRQDLKTWKGSYLSLIEEQYTYISSQLITNNFTYFVEKKSLH